MSQFERIETFVKLAEGKNFTQVANTLRVSTAAVSKQIQQLEAEIGLKLFERTTRKMTLTDAGTEFFEQCKRLMNEAQQTYFFAAKLRKEPSGELRITSNRYFGEQFILPYLSDFLTRFPKITLNLELAERFPDMNQEQVDLIFGVSIVGPDHLIQKKIGTTRYVLAGSPEYFKKHGTPKKPKDLIQHQYITHSMRKPDTIIPFKNEQEIHVTPFLRLNDTQAMLKCAIEGIGIIRVHDYIINQSLKDQSLIEILKESGEPEQPIYLYYKSNRFIQPKIRCFIDYFTKKLLKY